MTDQHTCDHCNEAFATGKFVKATIHCPKCGDLEIGAMTDALIRGCYQCQTTKIKVTYDFT